MSNSGCTCMCTHVYTQTCTHTDLYLSQIKRGRKRGRQGVPRSLWATRKEQVYTKRQGSLASKPPWIWKGRRPRAWVEGWKCGKEPSPLQYPGPFLLCPQETGGGLLGMLGARLCSLVPPARDGTEEDICRVAKAHTDN